MPEHRIRLLHNFRDTTPFEMTYFLEPAHLHLIHNRMIKFYVAVAVTDVAKYLSKQVCDLTHCPADVGENGRAYDFHGEIDDLANLTTACAALVNKYCPEGYKFYEVGIAAQREGYTRRGSEESKFGNIEIQYCPAEFVIPPRDAAGHRDKPDFLIVVNIHLNTARSDTPLKDEPLIAVVSKFTADFRARAVKGVREISLDSFLGVRRGVDGVDVTDEGDPRDPCRGKCFTPPYHDDDSRINIEKYERAWEVVNQQVREQKRREAEAKRAAEAATKAAVPVAAGGAGDSLAFGAEAGLPGKSRNQKRKAKAAAADAYDFFS